MGLLDKLKTSILGLGGSKPSFGIDPLNKLHNTYSTDGSPDVKWRTISGEGMKPQPSRLDFAEGKDKYNAKNKYTGK